VNSANAHRPDPLVCTDRPRSVTWRRGKRDERHGAEFGAQVVVVPAPAAGTRRLAVVDWDGDGRADLLFTENAPQPVDPDGVPRAQQTRRVLSLHLARQTS
jgi:hypothetical protein